MPDVTTDQMRCAGYVSGDNGEFWISTGLGKAVAGIRMGFHMRVINLLKWTALCGAFGVVGCASRTVVVRERVVHHEPGDRLSDASGTGLVACDTTNNRCFHFCFRPIPGIGSSARAKVGN